MQSEVTQARSKDKSSHNIVVKKQEFSLSCEGWAHAKDWVDENSARLSVLTGSHPEFSDPGTIFPLFTVMLACSGGLGLDSILLSNPAQYLASSLFAGLPLLAVAALFVVPLAFFGIELYIALKLANAQHLQACFVAGAARTERLLLDAGLAWAALVALTVLAANLAGAMASGMLVSHFILAVAMAGLALLVHTLLLFGGEMLHDAGRLMVFLLQCAREKWAIRSARRLERLHRREILRTLPELLGAIRVHAVRYGEVIDPGPFSRAEKRALAEFFPEGLPPDDPESQLTPGPNGAPPNLPAKAKETSGERLDTGRTEAYAWHRHHARERKKEKIN